MTFEQMIAELARHGWHVWNLSEGTRGTWTCRLWCRHAEPAGARGTCGYDRTDAWRLGAGPNPVAAMSAAAADILQPPMEETLDLAAMLA